jgi:hypothetical protein
MCDYQGYEFGAGTYPDSICINGTLYDADNCDGEGNFYDTGLETPCPMCRKEDAVDYWYNANFYGDNHEEATRCAISLVMDIRKNRGVFGGDEGG